MAEPFKIVAFCPVWKRREVLEVWWEGIQRLQRTWRECFEWIPFCVVSCDEDEQWVKDKGIKYSRCENLPLGRKHVLGLQAIREMEWDYICQISSDSLLFNNALGYYLAAMMEGHEVIGVKSTYFYNAKTKDVIFFQINNGKNKLIGGNRMIKRNVIEALDYQLWDEPLNRGLDFSSQSRIRNVSDKEPYEIKTDEIIGCEIRTDLQITSWQSLKIKGKPINRQRIFDCLSESEKELILQI